MANPNNANDTALHIRSVLGFIALAGIRRLWRIRTMPNRLVRVRLLAALDHPRPSTPPRRSD
jgi:hypothetical protein